MPCLWPHLATGGDGARRWAFLDVLALWAVGAMRRLRTAQAETIGTIVFDAPVSWGEKVKNVKGVSVVKMFRVTKYVNSPDLLQPWIDHLTALGIKKEIRKDGPPGRSYSLWREGEEVITEKGEYRKSYWKEKRR